jgi:hypothetical protein
MSLLSRVRELQRLELEKSEVEKKKARKETSARFGKRTENANVQDELEDVSGTWKELLVGRQDDIIKRLQEAVSEKKDNSVEMRRNEAKEMKENIYKMVSPCFNPTLVRCRLYCSILCLQVELSSSCESDEATTAWIENQNWTEWAEELKITEENLMKREANVNASQIVANQFRQHSSKRC